MDKKQLEWLIEQLDKKIEEAEYGNICVRTVQECKDLVLKSITK